MKIVTIQSVLWTLTLYSQASKAAKKSCSASQGFVNGKCVDCPEGYYGSTCSDKCFGKTYGFRCNFSCNCTLFEKCHHIYGCIGNKATTVLEDELGLQTTSVYKEVIDQTESTSSDINKKALVSYISLIGLACLLSTVVMICVALMIKRKYSYTANINDSQDVEDVASNKLDKVDDYEIIDEGLMIDPESKHNELENFKNCSMGSSKNQSDQVELDFATDGYLHPYNVPQQYWQQCDQVNNEEDSNISNDGYLNPYQPLQENWKDYTHIYHIISNEKTESKGIVLEEATSFQEHQDEQINIITVDIQKDKIEINEAEQLQNALIGTNSNNTQEEVDITTCNDTATSVDSEIIISDARVELSFHNTERASVA